jgi:hypothetical protein
MKNGMSIKKGRGNSSTSIKKARNVGGGGLYAELGRFMAHKNKPK